MQVVPMASVFPTWSNNLKALGKLVGASWTTPHASGLQSLVWRHRWEGDRGKPVPGNVGHL